jgi:CO/xanthine dehydrogenase Mo-binding subunit
MGQKPDVTIKKIVARELGIPVNRIGWMPVDTATTPDSGITSSSRTTVYVGGAAKLAAVKLREMILDEARVLTEIDNMVIDPTFYRICNQVTGDCVLTIASLVDHLNKEGKNLVATATFDPEVINLDATSGMGQPYITYSYGCHVAEVLVNMDTFDIQVIKYCAVHDSGKIIDLENAIGQVQGGIAMGIGLALTEMCVIEKGRVISDSFSSYKMPRVLDMPNSLEIYFVESNDRHGPFGSKGLAEPAVVPVAAAIANAICDAVGVPINKLPVFPQDVWEAFGNLYN